MKKYAIKIISLALTLAIMVSIAPNIGAAAEYIESGARILLVEYQGEELSKSRDNPTVLEWAGESVDFCLVGNPACATLNTSSDYFISTFLDGMQMGGWHSAFNTEGKAGSGFSYPAYVYVGNDVFEVYWNIYCATAWRENETEFEIIPNSESPMYYITFNQGEYNHEVPQGDVPTIVRAELNNVELSTDINNPTVIPYYNGIKLVGNSACVSTTIDVQIWYNGLWTRSGPVVLFSSYALGSCRIWGGYEYEGNPLYGETVLLEFGIHDNDGCVQTKSPAYYIVFQNEESIYTDFEANGLFQTVSLAANQLVVEVKGGYIFDGSNMILKDMTEHKEYLLGVWYDNPDCVGVLTNKIVYSNLPLKTKNIYELTIPAGAILRKTGGLNPDDYISYMYNKEYTATLIVESPSASPDVKRDYRDGNDVIIAAEDVPLDETAGTEDKLEPSLWLNPFADVKVGDWFYEYVQFVCALGLMSGTAKEKFAPSAELTRGMVATVLYRYSGSPDVSDIINPFEDVAAGMWYSDAVIWAAENGIVNGYGNDMYGPGDSITREQLTTIIYNYVIYIGEGPEGAWMILLGFEDLADISDWALESVVYCSMKGIITGKTGNRFDPKGNATRAEFAAVLQRLIQ